MISNDKYYWNGKDWYPKRSDYPDGSGIIEYEDGTMMIIEACANYNEKMSLLYFWSNGFPFALN